MLHLYSYYSDLIFSSKCPNLTVMCYRREEVPDNKYAFNISVTEARPKTKWSIFPGPGRYNPKPPKCLKLKSLSWPFKSTTERKTFLVN